MGFCHLFFWVDCTSLPILYWPLPNWCSGLLWRLDFFTLWSTFLLFPNLQGLWPFLPIKAAICTWFIALSAKILVTCKHEIKFPTFKKKKKKKFPPFKKKKKKKKKKS